MKPLVSACAGAASPPPSGGSCSGMAAWNSATAYIGGSQVVLKVIELCSNLAKLPTLVPTLSSHLWVAKWWTQGDTPGGTSPLLMALTLRYLLLPNAPRACGPVGVCEVKKTVYICSSTMVTSKSTNSRF
jgi:hypothetical protein